MVRSDGTVQTAHLTVNTRDIVCQVEGCGGPLSEFAGHLAFESQQGAARWISAAQLSDKLRDHSIRLVTLNACQSGVGRRSADVFNGLAQRLIQEVPAVVATPFHISWEAATLFARFFYQGLLSNLPLVDAVDRARQALVYLEGAEREWYRYVLYLREEDERGGELFNVRPMPPGDVAQVYLCDFTPPTDVPLAAKLFDWHFHFTRDRGIRKVPAPRVWRHLLLPQLLDWRTELGQQRPIHVYGTASLPTAFAFGHVFKRYPVEVHQSYEGSEEPWSLSAQPPADAVAPRFREHILNGNPENDQAIVMIYAVLRNGPAEVAVGVANFWKDQSIRAIFPAQTNGDQPTCATCRSVLLLETDVDQRMSGWEASALARSSRRQLANFKSQYQPRQLHLFLAVPMGLALFLGYQWNAIGLPVQCYDFVGGESVYQPTCSLFLG